jgi:hypothetical protein
VRAPNGAQRCSRAKRHTPLTSGRKNVSYDPLGPWPWSRKVCAHPPGPGVLAGLGGVYETAPRPTPVPMNPRVLVAAGGSADFGRAIHQTISLADSSSSRRTASAFSSGVKGNPASVISSEANRSLVRAARKSSHVAMIELSLSLECDGLDGASLPVFAVGVQAGAQAPFWDAVSRLSAKLRSSFVVVRDQEVAGSNPVTPIGKMRISGDSVQGLSPFIKRDYGYLCSTGSWEAPGTVDWI